MSKSKPAASSTLSLLNQMSTDRKRDTARKTAEKQAEEKARKEASEKEASREAELAKEKAAEEARKAEEAEKARLQAAEAERARIEAKKEEAALREAKRLADAGKAAEARAEEEFNNEPIRLDYSETSTQSQIAKAHLTSVVKAGKTQFQSMVKERKNIRKNFLLTPSNSDHLREEAEELGTSMNDLLNLILEDRYN